MYEFVVNVFSVTLAVCMVFGVFAGMHLAVSQIKEIFYKIRLTRKK